MVTIELLVIHFEVIGREMSHLQRNGRLRSAYSVLRTDLVTDSDMRFDFVKELSLRTPRR